MSKDPSPRIEIHGSRAAMGAAAAQRFQRLVSQSLADKGSCRVIFGCAPSQDEFFASLVREARAKPADWKRVEVFHMDEYVGLSAESAQNFRTYLRRNFLDLVQTASFHLIRGESESATAEAERYASLLSGSPIDVIAMGIGENGHVAFNDPPVADFADPLLTKVVEMDEVCRQQQVNDGCFETLASVPRKAITITIPVFAKARNLCAIVPGPRKARAVRDALLGPIGPACPATVLRTHPHAEVFLDHEASLLYASNSTL
ncbi:MAG TPA: 6-phosphogluconolactonase [Opitutaceae bacterium]|jgi:glucosamine-6-phosphate deaminase|nr:6-phosphogluconolactonase [Opitutaceae bacterium]